MSWETTGTVTVTNNSATVTGSGTLFTVKSRVGDAFIGPDGALYEIVNIVSNTVLSISPTYKGDTGSAKAYKIAPVRGYQKLSADRLYTIVNTIGDAVEVVTDLPAWLKAKQPTPVSAGGTGAETQLAARQNLGLKGAAVLDIGTTAGTVAAGDDARLTDAREWTAATISQAEAEAGTATTRRAFTAQSVRQAIVAWFNGISGALGRTILTRTTTEQVRTDIGLGTAATYNVGTAVGQVNPVGDVATFCLDIDDETQRGEWYVIHTTSGVKPTTYGIVNTYGSTGDSINQEFVELVGGGDTAVKRRFCRNKYKTNAWSPWTEYITSSSLQATTGQAAEYPMSQKATTEALNTKANTASLGTAATANLTNSTTDGTVGSVLKVGDFGLGLSVVLSSDNIDLISSNLTGAGAPGTTGALPSGVWSFDGWIITTKVWASSSIRHQEMTRGGTRYIRNMEGDVWLPWVRQVSTEDILPATGSSTDHPMSQKATTDALDLKANSSSLGTAATKNLGNGDNDIPDCRWYGLGASPPIVSDNQVIGGTKIFTFMSTSGSDTSGLGSYRTFFNLPYGGGNVTQLSVLQGQNNVADLSLTMRSITDYGITAPVSFYHTGNTLNIGTTSATARSALELGTAATKNVGTAIGNVMEVGSTVYALAPGATMYNRTAIDSTGAGIAADGINTLYVIELETDNYLTATGLKVNGVAPTWQVLASRGLTLGAQNAGGTQNILGATNNDNVRMYCETRMLT